MQGSSGDADVENRLADIARKGVGGTNGKSNNDIYILLCVKQITSGKLLYSTGTPAWHSVMAERGGMRGGERLRREATYVYLMADSCCCMAETKNIVKQFSSN